MRERGAAEGGVPSALRADPFRRAVLVRSSADGEPGAEGGLERPGRARGAVQAPAQETARPPDRCPGHVAVWASASGREQVAPAIVRARGRFRTEYTGTTLREHHGLPRPANRLEAAAENVGA